MEEYTNYLAHHGVKGMKWGVRRYQNKDGSLTSAGRKKYGSKSKGKKVFDSLRKEKRYFIKVNGKRTQVSKKEYKKANKLIKRYKKEQEKHKQRMSDPRFAAEEALKSDVNEIKKATEKYRATADYLDQRSRLSRQVYQTKSSRLEKAVNVLDKVSKIANSAASIKGSYDKVFGGPSELDTINLQKARNDLANSNLNLKRTSLMLDKLSYEYKKTLYSDANQNYINRAKSDTIFRTQSLTNEQLDEFTKRKKKENDFLETVFKQYDYKK